MTVTKRTRFEILRRDNHTCQYCGDKAPNVVLHIDHVVPVSLGGDDKPGNLVAACKDCNAGKASIQPDSPLVQSLSAEAAAYALGMIDKMTRFREDLESLDDYVDEFHELWDTWKIGDKQVPLPPEYRSSLFRWKQMGIPTTVYDLAIPNAMSKFSRDRFMKLEGIFSYMAGIVWNMVNEREIDSTVTHETAAVYTDREAQNYAERQWLEGRRSGERVGREGAVSKQIERDFLQHHIDRMEPQYEPHPFSDELVFVGLARKEEQCPAA